MGEAQEVKLHIMGQELKEVNSTQPTTVSQQSTVPDHARNYKRWIRISIYVVFLLVGQSVATILGRLYFVKGGKSKWLATLVQIVGFPILLPYFYFSTSRSESTDIDSIRPLSVQTRVMVYVPIGILAAGNCLLLSVGMQYLPVSTYSLILASQLAFNAFLSFFLNSQKFTPYIVNSLVLLTISSALLAVNNKSANPPGVSKEKYSIGFVCTIAAALGGGLLLSGTQFCFEKVIKKQTFKALMDMILYQEMVATCVILVGLFASGDWNDLTREMNEYQLGKVSYVMNLLWTCITWQLIIVGCVGLILEVSSLFCNAISVLGLPIVPVLAVFVFHDKLDAIKAISMVLAVWGFISYVYQHYIDYQNCQDSENTNADDFSKPTAMKG